MDIQTSDIKNILKEIEVIDIVRHPNIIQTMAVYIDNKNIKIIMELFQSYNLHQLIFEEEAKEEFLLNDFKKDLISSQLCKAVTYLQSQNIIHRDLKPRNILVNDEGNLKLCDFGLSKICKDSNLLNTTVAVAKGTPLYMAPEILNLDLDKKEAKESDVWTEYCDVWSVGCILFELFAETPVWNSMSSKQFIDFFNQKEPLPDMDKILNLEIKHEITKWFSKVPTNRPKMQELLIFFNRNSED